ncbi:serine/threonine-protein kinase [Nocardiopsis suaedae]|uniref:Serine/threonine-protein kinase n=1 Tax=Nocardiopsis suaedae TaxID=3018444 RepID=A0ABT4TMS4_9ACTN|nr:serine/threonine-protein kinase [Nocardiopsis suaedae]MDA2805989.1 serine/threonine-protein kinase [Nocardiopsis suaedae]
MPGPESLSSNDPASIGDYSVEGRLGKGGQGVVYLGRDRDGEEVAIKVLNDQWAENDELRARFEKEVRAAQKVASFCTAAIHAANLDDDPPFVVSEYVDGPSLQEAVAKSGPRRGAGLQRLAVNTATALVAIHKAGIVHRDFKPGNVLLGPDGPRVIDFGIARVDDGQATLTNSIVGTPSYMAPEQIEGRGITDKVDVFAWGCVMAFASTGNAPFGADSVPAVVHRVVSAPPSLDGMPEELLPVVRSCLDKDPSRRPSAKELLMRLLGHDPAEGASTEEVVREGERAAETGAFAPPPGAPSNSGPQTPMPPQGPGPGRPATGPQPPYPPHSGPQTPMPPQGPQTPPPMGPQPGPSPMGPQTPPPGMGHPGGPMGPPPPNMGPGGPMGPQTIGPNTTMGGPNSTMGPGTFPGGMPQQPQSQEDPVLSQGWVIPAVLVTIIILVLILVLVALSG